MSHRLLSLQMLLSLTLGLGFAAPAAAQSSSTSPGTHGQFFLYAAPGWPSAGDALLATRFTHIGGGGEAALGNKLGIGTDFGAILGGTRSTVATLAINGFYHFEGQHPASIDPYATAGLAAFLWDPKQRAAGANVGAGINWWTARKSLGIGVELRQSAAVGYREVRVTLRLWQ